MLNGEPRIEVREQEGEASRRWRTLVERRRQQMDAAYAAIGRSSHDYWQRRLNRASGLRRRAAPDDPLLQMLLACSTPETTLIDVGAGAGRYTRALAPRLAQIRAVEPDEAMADMLATALDAEEIGNVELIRATWQELEPEPVDLVLCSHVLYPIADAAPFLRKLDRSARRACFLALRETAPEPEPLGRLWQRHHGEPRYLQPGFIDAYNLLHELGIYANVRIVRMAGSMWTFESLDQAVTAVREHLILPETPAIDAELREELAQALVPDGEYLSLPMQLPPSAIIWWEH